MKKVSRNIWGRKKKEGVFPINLDDLPEHEKLAYVLMRIQNTTRKTTEIETLIGWVRGTTPVEEDEIIPIIFNWCCDVLDINIEYARKIMEGEIKKNRRRYKNAKKLKKEKEEKNLKARQTVFVGLYYLNMTFKY